MFQKLIHLISAERSNSNNTVFSPTIAQHKKAYAFCKTFIKDKTVIEIGCGNGFGAYQLSETTKSIIAIDNDQFAIEECKIHFSKENIVFVFSSIEKFNYEKKIDVIISLQVIEHLTNPEILLQKAQSLLKKNGIFIISTPNATTQSYNENPYHLKEFTDKELKTLLSKYFKNVKIYGLHGDKKIMEIENKRREQITKILELDLLHIRKLIPRTLNQRFFDVASLLNRFLISLRTKNTSNFSEENFSITNTTENAIDLIAVCS